LISLWSRERQGQVTPGLLVGERQGSRESSVRIRCHQRHDAVAEFRVSVNPIGLPISHSTNCGFNRNRRGEVGAFFDDFPPAVDVVRSGRERESLSISVRVATFRLAPLCLPLAAEPPLCPCPLGDSPVSGVGQDEESLPLLREADFCRTEEACRNAVAHSLKVVVDFFKTQT